MSVHDWLSLGLICVLGAFSPGPSLMVILGVTASEGRKKGFVASFGHGLGVFFYALLSATGLSILLVVHANLFSAIQLLGAFFLFYLGFRIFYPIFFGSWTSNVKEKEVIFSNPFRDGFLIAILNPKIAAFFLSLFSQFLIDGQLFLTHLIMAVVAGTIDTFAYVTMVFLASTSLMSRFLSDYKKPLECFFGIVLIVLACSLLLKIANI